MWPLFTNLHAFCKSYVLVRMSINVRNIGPFTYKRELKTDVPKLVASASGVVVEVGPGNGNQVGRYDKSKVTKVCIPLPVLI